MHVHKELILQWLQDINQPVFVNTEGGWVRCVDPRFHPLCEYRIDHAAVTPHPHADMIHKKLLWPHLKFEMLDHYGGWDGSVDMPTDPFSEYRHAWGFTVGDVVKPVDGEPYAIRVTSMGEFDFVGRCVSSDDKVWPRLGDVLQCLNVSFINVEGE